MRCIDYSFLEQGQCLRQILGQRGCKANVAKLYSFGYYLLFLIGVSLVSLQAAPLDINAMDREWQALFDEMHAVERVATSFEESRTFAFRKAPKLYRGVFRKEADGRVSLAYTEPEAIALHIGDGFAYYRKGEGRVRRIPNSNSQSGALAIFPQLLNFDLIALGENYEISGDIEGGVWHLSFVADEDSSEDLPYQSMRVDGQGTAVRRIELSKSQKQAVVIEMQDPVYPDFYLPEIKAQYFFRPDSEE